MEGDFLQCAYEGHRASGSVYPRARVPTALFADKHSTKLLKYCIDCRQHNQKIKRRFEKRRRETLSTANPGQRLCGTCMGLLVAEETKKTCGGCRARSFVNHYDSKAIQRMVMTERIQKMGHCCRVCQKVFIRAEKGFDVLDSLANVAFESIEFRNLEFDHLSREEQIAQHGEYFGPKTNGVSTKRSYATIKHESMKCQLVCLRCHVKETLRRFPGTFKMSRVALAKKAFADAAKLAAAHCGDCGEPVDPDLLTYYEFDHVDPRTKVIAVSQMYDCGDYSLDDIKAEIAVCRVICKFCHRCRTKEQMRKKHK